MIKKTPKIPQKFLFNVGKTFLTTCSDNHSGIPDATFSRSCLAVFSRNITGRNQEKHEWTNGGMHEWIIWDGWYIWWYTAFIFIWIIRLKLVQHAKRRQLRTCEWMTLNERMNDRRLCAVEWISEGEWRRERAEEVCEWAIEWVASCGWVNEWMLEWVNEGVNVWKREWWSKRESGGMSDGMSEPASDWEAEWVDLWVSEWVSGWAREWQVVDGWGSDEMSDWVGESVGDWVAELWVSESMWVNG